MPTVTVTDSVVTSGIVRAASLNQLESHESRAVAGRTDL